MVVATEKIEALEEFRPQMQRLRESAAAALRLPEEQVLAGWTELSSAPGRPSPRSTAGAGQGSASRTSCCCPSAADPSATGATARPRRSSSRAGSS